MSPSELVHLQRAAGNAAVARLVQSGHGPAQAASDAGTVTVQRNPTYGNDPVAGIANTDMDLLYGITPIRARTKARLGAGQKAYLRTIDEYNKAIGINSAMGASTAAMGLFDIRDELNSAAAWGLPQDATANAQTTQWIAFLRQHAAYIGLEYLGQSAGWFGTDKIKKKDRFTKNRKEPQTGEKKKDRLTPGDVRSFLGSSTKASAQKKYNKMSAKKKSALNEWIYRAFFRRTSKLGQDFAITVLGGKVWFNTRADPDWDPIMRARPIAGRGEIDQGLIAMDQGNVTDNRSITISELRHMRKRRAHDPAYANAYEEYGE
ncbi:MAG TPA: hypothetical protein VHX88_11775 [Solirubrobacteraceae bacterium]|nr:hypothetical protein [Solirubrobacteraceae bacterium]